MKFKPYMPPLSNPTPISDSPTMDELRRRPITVLSSSGKMRPPTNKAIIKIRSKYYMVPGLLMDPV